MNCSELEQMLCPYLDGEFGPAERSELEAHLATCAVCASKVHHEAAFRSAFRARAQQAATVVVPDALRTRIRGSLRTEQRRNVVRTVLPYAAAAALVAVAGSSYALLRPEARVGFLDDAVKRHARNLPVEVRIEDPAQVERWFDDKLDHRVHVPRLQNARLAGARVSNVKDREAAYISYEVNPQTGATRRIGVFAFPDRQRDLDAEPLQRVEVLRTDRGYNVATWREDEIVYQLVTDLDVSDIRRMLLDQGIDATYGHTPPARPEVQFQPAGLQR